MDEHALTVKTACEYLYHVVVRGECGPVTQRLLGDVTIEAGRGYTTIIFPDRDATELYGLLDRIQDLALHLISIRRSPAPQPYPDPEKPRVTGQVPLQTWPD